MKLKLKWWKYRCFSTVFFRFVGAMAGEKIILDTAFIKILCLVFFPVTHQFTFTTCIWFIHFNRWVYKLSWLIIIKLTCKLYLIIALFYASYKLGLNTEQIFFMLCNLKLSWNISAFLCDLSWFYSDISKIDDIHSYWSISFY